VAPLLLRLVAVALAALLTAACAATTAEREAELPEQLRVGLIPNVAPDEQRARYEPFGEHLAEVLDVEVELFVASDYAGVVTALANERLDIAYLGGLTYLQAEEQVELTPLVTEVDQETGTSRYLSAFVVADDAPIGSLDDLLAAEGRVALGDVSSTSGSLYPKVMLAEAGADCDVRRVDVCPPLSSVTFTGGHDAAAQAVLTGAADAAGLELRILHRLERDGVVPEGALRVIETTEVEGYPWVARSALGRDVHDELRDAFLGIDDPDLLDLLRAEDYVTVAAEDYVTMRDQAEALGLLDVG
jgi:phosphonate transport system substrate-binding protein